MRRILALFLLLAALGGGAPAFAKGYADQVIDQLRAQGFQSIHVEKTWLGRMRIHATDQRGEREIIVNPATGEILRDLWLVRFRQGAGDTGSADRATIRDDSGLDRGPGRDDDRADDKDSDRDDDKDKDKESSDDDGHDD